MHLSPQTLSQLMPKSTKSDKQHNKECDATTNLPEIPFRFGCIHNALNVHAKVRGEKTERKEDDGDTGEDEDGFILRVRDDRHVILLYTAKLKELYGKYECLNPAIL